jgi:hypothetical protein
MKSPKIDHFVQGESEGGHISRTVRPIELRFSTDIHLGEFLSKAHLKESCQMLVPNLLILSKSIMSLAKMLEV